MPLFPRSLHCRLFPLIPAYLSHAANITERTCRGAFNTVVFTFTSKTALYFSVPVKPPFSIDSKQLIKIQFYSPQICILCISVFQYASMPRSLPAALVHSLPHGEGGGYGQWGACLLSGIGAWAERPASGLRLCLAHRWKLRKNPPRRGIFLTQFGDLCMTTIRSFSNIRDSVSVVHEREELNSLGNRSRFSQLLCKS